MAKPKIVAAIGSAAGKKKIVPAPEGMRVLSVERAMADAVKAALAEGVTDQNEIRRRQLAARDSLLGR
jgi:hypothetical protein